MTTKTKGDPWADVRREVAWVKVALAKLDARAAELKVSRAEHPEDEGVSAALVAVQADADQLRGSLRTLDDHLRQAEERFAA